MVFKYFNLMVLVVLIVFGVSLAGDVFNQDVTLKEGKTSVSLVYYSTAGSDSTGSVHSKPIFIGDINDQDFYLQVKANATTDYNVIFHYSNDKTLWQEVTATGLDACSNSAKYDTLGNGEQTPFHKYDWLVIELDGQAGANPSDSLKITGSGMKDFDLVTSSGGQVGATDKSPGSITNP